MRLTSWLLILSAGLACGPDKNDTETGGSTGTSTGTSTGADTTGGESGVPTGGSPSEGSGDSSAGGTGTGTGETGTTGATTGPADGCEALQTQAQCEQDPDCMAVVGQAFDFPDCMPGQTFIACMPMMPCDSNIQDICEEDELDMEVYRLPNGCIPPGFKACLPGDFPFCGDSECEGLPEQDCLAAPDCTAIMGAPHIEQGGEVCVDFDMQEFLACAQGDVACPPTIASVCPGGQPEMVFDTPSGCIPPGFMPCDMPAPECQ